MRIKITYEYDPSNGSSHCCWASTTLPNGHAIVRGASNFEAAKVRLIADLQEQQRVTTPPPEEVEI
jgi:hypothetical protein